MPPFEQHFSHAKNSFSACHFLIGFDKCERLHGHDYKVAINLKYSQEEPTSTLDFRLVNSVIRHELNQLNQKILLPNESPNIQIHSSAEGKNWEIIVNDRKTYSFPNNW